MKYIKVRVKELLNSNVINFTTKHKEKHKERNRKRFHSIIKDGVFSEIGDQYRIEQEVIDELKKIDLDSKTMNKKFMYPSVLSEYDKGTNPNPIAALKGECDESTFYNYNNIPPKIIFAIKMAYKHKDEVVPYLKEDYAKLAKIRKLAKTAIAPQYAERPIGYVEQSLMERILFYEKDISELYNKLKEKSLL